MLDLRTAPGPFMKDPSVLDSSNRMCPTPGSMKDASHRITFFGANPYLDDRGCIGMLPMLSLKRLVSAFTGA